MYNKGQKVSIITVCYNSAKTIRDTIESVLNQTYENIEYIIIDGVSQDGTMDIVSSYISKFQGRLKIISEPDKGIYDAMNKGILMCTGDIVGIINSDDWYEQDAVEKVCNAFSDITDVSIVYGGIRYVRNEMEDSIHFYSHNFLPERMISHPSCFVLKTVYDNIGIFNCKYKIVADYDLMLRAMEKGIKFYGIHEVLSNFRLGGASNSRKTDEELNELYYEHGYYSLKEYRVKKIQMKHAMVNQKIKSFFKLNYS